MGRFYRGFTFGDYLDMYDWEREKLYKPAVDYFEAKRREADEAKSKAQAARAKGRRVR